MWALRRASLPLRNQAFNIRSSRACCANLELPITYGQEDACFHESCKSMPDGCLSSKRLYYTTQVSWNFSVDRRSFSSQAGAESSGEEDDLEDGFSELETLPSAEASQHEDELISEPELSEDEEEVEPSQHELELSENGADSTEKRSPRKRNVSALFKAILAFPGFSVHGALDKWVKAGNDLNRAEISLAMFNFRKRLMFGRALQLSEWLEEHKQIEFVERDYASRVDLIAKVRGLYKAEKYIETIPASFRGEVIYRTLLANAVSTHNLKKSEEIFNKMKDLEFPVTPFTCNQLLLIYKRLDKKKMADVLLLMEKENVKPTAFTYKLLIDTKGQCNDMTGMDQVYETMKAEGFEPDITVKATLAKHYAAGGLKEKAEAVLKDMEGGNLKENRWACQALLPLYAELGQVDEVERVWKVCESNPRLQECMAAIEAWGKLNKIEEAEAVFEKMSNTFKKLSSKHYYVLLKVYANGKKLTKGKDLVKRMADSNCDIGPLTWDALVKLYVGAGELEKADSMLQKAAQTNRMKPLFNSYMTIMEQYSKKGDTHNAEKIFYRMRQAGYTARLRQFQSLIQAYINAKTSPYGIWERMKADNIFPNKSLLAQLAQVDPFKKTAVSDLLD
ncbi:pentatricopeptide repeat-containing protein At1g80270, mitochondrial-like isoform X2 [Prunus avium]|uniref:Pentatricopeptide repeat-containing protein At1g80270, mitochondrial-like isoform X2 n=1 Tax=Prunus avium TaxID=42229 RepID=A0A6P5T482_PRUAV|nr:pentatricopeptide repeat-containing protein At1g80270, mitochondrial-like isoform X2 [Prunus avium]